MDIIKRARELRAIIENMATGLTDEEALYAPELYPNWAPEQTYNVGERVRFDGTLYRVIQTHDAQAEWTPAAAPSLFAEVLPGQDDTEPGEWVQPDSTNGYMTGDRVTYDGKTWESTVNGNVWTPGTYGWVVVA